MSTTTTDGVKCRICGSGNMEEDRCLGSTDAFVGYPSGAMYHFLICGDCKTVQCQDGGILDYATDSTFYNKTEYIDYDLACDAGVYFFSFLLLLAESIVKKSGQKRILEVGGGLGITSHIAKLCLGWREQNVDPNIRGALARETLAIDSFSGYTDDLGSEHHGKYDVVLFSEVLEHIPEPDAFLRSLKPFLAEDGVFFLSTPNSEAVALSCNRNADFIDVIESYSVGQHYNLYSKDSLRLLLERNGFEGITIGTSEGESNDKRLVAVARQRGAAPAAGVGFSRKAINHLFKEYAAKAKAEPTRNDFHATYKNGLDFRLFETLVNEGEYAEAWKIGETINAYLAARNSAVDAMAKPSADTFVEMMEKYVPYAGKYFYYYGLLCMNHLVDYPSALRYFSAAYVFTRMQNGIYYSHIGRYTGLAAIHKARVLGFVGKRDEGIALLREALKLERIPGDVRVRMSLEIEALRAE